MAKKIANKRMAKDLVNKRHDEPLYDKAKYKANKETEERSRAERVETLAAQMKKRGINPDNLKDPGVMRDIGKMIIPTEKGKKPFVYIPKTGKKQTFKRFIRRVMDAAHGVLTGSVLTGKQYDVAPNRKKPKKEPPAKKEVKGEPGRLEIPTKRKGSDK
jgi:hypothetical protein